ncbi:CIC11C00000003980 [Sungouiella intermedia]|uniref:Repressor of RNA polymerase III transcription MAF1 n=1 Tax=Sungouiella intermedia TaxID=45354 RepID=A0A1L0BCI0_9ASCO|nr:CIC11C00000003980 [[Candida] intermedia]SGZ49171.1 CIC11C00000002482 [[Candida] intermedia]
MKVSSAITADYLLILTGQFIDEVDIELVNQELNFHSPDNNLVIKGGCDLFTTKPIGTDKKLFRTIDKHLDQIMEDNQLSQSIERDRQHSINSLLGSSASPLQSHFVRRGSFVNDKDRRPSNSLLTFNKNEVVSFPNSIGTSNLSLSLLDDQYEEVSTEESPFGPLKNSSTRRKFAYLIAVLNTTYPDHDFSNLQPTTENFHKVESPEVLINRFNNIMVSLGKREDLLSWIWDIVNVYMDMIPPRSQNLASSNSRKNSVINSPIATSPKTEQHPSSVDHCCKIYEFQPSDQSILEDLNHPYQTMWSYYWFIYNKKKKRVCFLYLTAINRVHFSQVRNNGERISGNEKADENREKNFDEPYSDYYMDDDMDNDRSDADIIGDMEM